MKTKTSSIVGYIDRINVGNIAGWVVDENNLERRLTVEILVNGEVKYSGEASMVRRDLLARFSNMNYGFSFGLAEFLKKGKNIVSARVRGESFDFNGRVESVDTRDFSQMVEVSDNGWLFLKNDSNDLNSVVEGKAPIKEQDLADISKMLKVRSSYFDDCGIKIITIVIPDKNVVCNCLKREPLSLSENRPALQIQRAVNDLPEWAWSYCPLENDQTDDSLSKIYRKKDTHLTDWGWYGYFTKIMTFCELDCVPKWKERIELNVGGDLGNKMDPPQTENLVRRVYESCGEIVLDEVSEALRNGLHLQDKWIINKNPMGNGLTVLVFGTSTPYYGRQDFFSVFGQTFIKWSTKVNYSDISRIKPDVVICVMAERYISGGWRDEN